MSFKLMVHAWDAEVPTQSHRLVLMKLVDCCDDDGRNIWPALATVAEKAMCSTRHVRRVIGEFCRIGLLRRLKAGGTGPGSTAHYEMDIDMLAKLGRPEMYPALLAAAVVDPLGNEDDRHAPDACHGEDGEPAGSSEKADSLSALDDLRRTPATPKADKLSPPTPYRPLKPERESAGASAGQTRPDGPVPDAGHAVHASGQASASGRPPATIEDFRAAYPHAGADDQAALASAWAGLPFDQRWPAIDGVAGFLDERKAAGFASRLSGPKYLAGQNWRHVPKQAAERAAKAVAGAPVMIAGWTQNWWLVLLMRIADGQRQRVSFAVHQANSNSSITATAADLEVAARRIGELKAYACDGPELEAWRPWLAEKGARIPVFNGTFRVFLPGPMPPGGKVDDGDCDVRF